MKFVLRYIPLIIVGLSSLALTGCIEENFESVNDSPAGFPLNAIGYMSVRLQNSSDMTRALPGDDYNLGTADDYGLCEDAGNFAIIYDGSQPTPIAIAELSAMGESMSSDKTANSSVAIATIVAKDETREALTTFKDCYIIINSNLKRDDLWSKTRDNLSSIIVDTPYFVDKSGKKYLTMCNSVYVENGKKKIDTSVDTNMIFETYMDALEQAGRGNAAINAYIERVAAKVNLKFENTAYDKEGVNRDFVPDYDNVIVFSHINENGIPHYIDRPANNSGAKYACRVRITGWGVNALEKESYLFRNFTADGNYFTNWYKTSDKRALWSEDLNYKFDNYPWQYRPSIEEPWIHNYKGNNNILQNLSYNELNVANFGSKAAYTLENTYNFKDNKFVSQLDERPEVLAASHIIVCAELLTNIKDVNKFEPTEMYRDRNGNFYTSEADCFKALVSFFNNTLLSHTHLKYTSYDWTYGGKQGTLYARTNGSYSLYYGNTKLTPENVERISGSLTSEANLTNGDGKRMIWMDNFSIRDDSGNILKIYTSIDEVEPSNDKYLRDATADDIKSLLYEYIGAVDHFNGGKMYYAVPIGYVSDNYNTVNPNYSIYGLVRNAEYNIRIMNVTGLGTPVDNPNDPIVPTEVQTNDHLFIGLEVIGWHTTDVTVPGAIN